MPAARNWTEQEISEIKRLYCEEGLSHTKIGKKFDTSPAAINRLLAKQGIDRKSKPTKIHEHVHDFYRRYKSGESFESIAKSYGYASGEAVAWNLEKAGLYQRAKKPDDISHNDYPAIINAYKEGVNMATIAKKYNCSSTAIRSVLLRSGIKLRTKSEAFGFPQESEYKDICDFYSEGNNLETTAQKFNYARSTIKKVLRLNNIRIKSLHEARTGIHPDEWDRICKRYIEDEEPTTAIARDYGVTYNTIVNILKSKGFEIRSVQERHMSIPRSQWKTVCESYRKGGNTYTIAAELGIATPFAVSRVLRINGIEIRGESEILGDGSIINVLMNEGRFKLQRETDFYIYSICSHPHYKPGIAFSHEDRANKSEGLYNEPELVQTYESRQEAWLVEYMVLEETSQYMDIPQELNGWPGSYELRLMDLEDLKSVYDFYDDQLEELGIYEYALKYVDMTEDEKFICEQRLGRR